MMDIEKLFIVLVFGGMTISIMCLILMVLEDIFKPYILYKINSFFYPISMILLFVILISVLIYSLCLLFRKGVF